LNSNGLFESRGKRLVWASRALVSLMIVATIGSVMTRFVVGLQSRTGELNELPLLSPLTAILVGTVALLIIGRHPHHVVGWLLLLLTFLFTLSNLLSMLHMLALSGRIDSSHPLYTFGTWLDAWIYFPQLMLPIIFLPLYFPTGKLLSPRWRIISLFGGAGVFLTIVGVIIHPGPYEPLGITALNPMKITGGKVVGDLLARVATPLLTISMISTLPAMFLRYRRAGVTERIQLKWLFYPLALAIFWFAGIVTPITLLGSPALQRLVNTQHYGYVDFWLLSAAIPLAMGIAILRYRLFDIDLIIRKTLVYAVVTASLAAVYFGSVVLLQQLSAGVSGEQSPLIIVVSTLIIAALFSRLRGRVQKFVDRRFYRSKYDAAQTLARFSRAARDETDLDALTAELVRVVQETMQPESAAVWLRPGDRSERPLPVSSPQASIRTS